MEKAFKNKIYTYEDYLKFPEGERVELIDGEIIAMTPGPSRMHQRITGYIYRMIGNFLEQKGGPCEVYVAPFDVRLIDEGETDEKNKNTVQPDISVICDKLKLDDRGCKGAPDFIIEVVSPSNSSVDYVKKLFLYEKFRVREYWIVNHETQGVIVYRLSSDYQYGEPLKYSFNDVISSAIFDGLTLCLKDII